MFSAVLLELEVAIDKRRVRPSAQMGTKVRGAESVASEIFWVPF